MNRGRTRHLIVLSMLALAFLAGWAAHRAGLFGVQEATAADTPAVSPTKALAARDVYYPGSEDLAADEMRIIACGTGMPNARPKQAAACWIVELGNGDKFIFDIGLGSAERIAAMKIPYDFLDKLFIGHLHADHIGDLDALWVGGSIANRQRPLRVWGPSGAEEKYGTKDDIRVRMAAYDEDIWPLPSITKKLAANPKDRVGFSDYVMGGRVVYEDVITDYYSETSKMFGTDFQPPK